MYEILKRDLKNAKMSKHVNIRKIIIVYTESKQILLYTGLANLVKLHAQLVIVIIG